MALEIFCCFARIGEPLKEKVEKYARVAKLVDALP